MTNESQEIVGDDSSPRHKHLRKLAAEAAALKKAKQNTKPLKVEIEVAYDTRGKPKYRKIFYMPNGNKHSEYLSEKSAEVQKLKSQKLDRKKL